MIENIRLSFRGIWSHKMRSFLTMLGIIIGIASIISIVSTIKGTNDAIKQNLVGSGNNTVDVKLSQSNYDYTIYSTYDIPSGIPMISDETKEKIMELDEVVSMTAYTSRDGSEGVYYKNTSLDSVSIRGIDTSYFPTCNYMVKTGRSFVAEDYEQFRKVMIVDETAASNLFQTDDPLGKVVEISGSPFTVVGVVKEASTFEPTISTISDYYTYASESKGFIYIPLASWPIVYTYDEPQNVIVKAKSTDDMTKAGQKTQEILNQTVTNENIKYKAKDLAEQARQLQDVSSATNNQLIWIASISLLVGGIGVMNIMLVSVTERTSEIGLKKALGARKRVILAQFLTEAAVLTSMGGILGVIGGIAMAEVIYRLSGVAVSISIPAAIIAVAFSMLIGIVFGLLPSVKAANLDPIEALRRE